MSRDLKDDQCLPGKEAVLMGVMVLQMEGTAWQRPGGQGRQSEDPEDFQCVGVYVKVPAQSRAL